MGSLWRRAAQVADGMGWQEIGLLDFSLRSFAQVDMLRSAASSLASSLTAAAARALQAVEDARSSLDDVAVAALLGVSPSPWAELPPRSPILLAGLGSAGDAYATVLASLTSAHLLPASWHRFEDEGCAAEPARAWPRAHSQDRAGGRESGGGGYAAAILRLPPSRGALEYALHAIASVLRPGGLLVCFGAKAEGIHTTRAHLPTDLYERASALETRKREAGAREARVCWWRIAPPIVPRRRRRSARRWRREECVEIVPPPGQSADAPWPRGPWTTLPGLFAGGGVDVMTSMLLGALPPPPKKAKVLDFCCGSGVIGAVLRARQPSLRLTLLDADAVALHAAGLNVPGAQACLSDGWASLPSKPRRFEWIVSNPPVHLGIQVDFRILRLLIDGAAKRLKRGGELWLVAQTYVPIGRLFAEQAKLVDVRAVVEDGRFVVWAARRAAKGGAGKGGRTTRMDGASTAALTTAPIEVHSEQVPPQLATTSSATTTQSVPSALGAARASDSVAARAARKGRGKRKRDDQHDQGQGGGASIDWGMSKAQRKRARRKAAATQDSTG